MTTTECRKKAGIILKGKYFEGIFVIMVLVVIYLIFKTIDIVKIGALLYNNNINILALYQTNSILDIFVKYLFGILAFAVMTPLITGGLWWFYQTANGEDNKNILKLYTGFKLNIRAFGLYTVMWILSTVSLLPTGLCWAVAGYIFDVVSEYPNQSIVLFISLQVFMFGVFFIGLYLKCISSIILAPFIFIKNPDRNIFKILNMARKKIYGSKLECIQLILTYILPMLPIVTIPFILPKAVMSFSVFACDRIGENIWDS